MVPKNTAKYCCTSQVMLYTTASCRVNMNALYKELNDKCGNKSREIELWRLLSVAKRISVSHSFCLLGLHSSFVISGIYSLCVPLIVSGAPAFCSSC